jgi:hypothetical protein
MAEGSDAITGKFDFYDVLGYLIPGLLLIGLLWLPVGLLKGVWPSTSITTAALYLVAAHIIGHILQGFIRSWERVPQIEDKSGRLRSPSSIVLDADQGLPPALRSQIGDLTEKFWKIPSAELLAENHDTERNAAFLQARNLLLQAKKQSYFEQFQGKYALLGGAAAVLLLTSAYYCGWAIAFIPSTAVLYWSDRSPWLFGVFLIFLVLCLIFGNRVRLDRVVLLSLLCLAAMLGGFVVANTSYQSAEEQKNVSTTCAVCCNTRSPEGSENHASPSLRIDHKSSFMLILALAGLGGAARCYSGYKAFAREFAVGVWRDFANFEIVAKDSDKG